MPVPVKPNQTSKQSAKGLTRRELIAGAGAAGLTLAAPGLGSAADIALVPPIASAARDNVGGVVIDSLRTDHVGVIARRPP